MTDEFKKPNHPTFSNESIYNGVDGKYGGVWGENSFTPSQWNLQNMPAAQMQQYFAENESGVQLNLPADTGVLEMLMKGKF